MRRYFGLLFEHQAMSATNTRATANAAARPTAEEMVRLGIVWSVPLRRSCLLASQGNRLRSGLKILQRDTSLNGLRRLERWRRVSDDRPTVRIAYLCNVRDADKVIAQLTLTIYAPHTPKGLLLVGRQVLQL